MCENEVYTETKYAFVSMLSGNLRLYAISAAKLGASIRRWSPLDMVMMEIKERPLDAEVRSHLQSVGWKICLVPAIPNPPSPKSNPYLDALMYTKLSVWGLVEYDAVAAIDSDMLVVNDPAPLFAHHLPLMRAANRSLAAARDRPLGSCVLVSWRSAPFNAGLLLLRPDHAALAALRHAVAHVPHDLDSAEQGLLNAVFPLAQAVHELPLAYNANVVARRCEAEEWEAVDAAGGFVVVHFTLAKGWTRSLSWRKWDDPLQCHLWGVADWCRLWDAIPA